MVPESLTEMVFSSQSDVWSFGVVVWELFSFGKVPYPGMNFKELMREVLNGYRMEKPQFVTNEIGRLMTNCWKLEPNERPTFCQLEQSIGGHLEAPVRHRYFDMNEPYVKLNEEIKRQISIENNQPPIDFKTRMVKRTSEIFNRSTSNDSSRLSQLSFESSTTIGIDNQAYESHN